MSRRPGSIAGKWALVTGASSGFGVEFATLLAERRMNLVLVARRTDFLEQLAQRLRSEHGVRVIVEGLDLSTSGSGTALKQRVDAQGIVVEALVNNADTVCTGTSWSSRSRTPGTCSSSTSSR